MLRNSLLIFVMLACMLTVLNANVDGGVSVLQGTEFQNAVKKLRVAVNKVKTLNGPSYTVSKVNRATEQVVSGIITRYRARLTNDNGVTRNCNASIWEQPWLPKGTQVTISCPFATKYTIKYDP